MDILDPESCDIFISSGFVESLSDAANRREDIPGITEPQTRVLAHDIVLEAHQHAGICAGKAK